MMPIFAGYILATALSAAVPVASTAAQAPTQHKVYGFVQSLTGSTLVIQNRTGQTIVVDGRLAHSVVHFYRGRPVIVFGTVDASGTMHASAIWRTYPDSGHWPADR